MCPACGSPDLRPLVDLGSAPVLCGVTWPDREAARASPVGRMELAHCPVCAHAYNAAFDELLLDYDATYDNSLHHSQRYRAYATGLARRLADGYALRGKHVIEIGSGKGDFLTELCATADCRGTGYDPSYDGRFRDDRVRFVKAFLDFDAAPEFDFFVSRHVLEHLADPFDLLRGLRSACGERRVQGFVEVPDAIYDLEQTGLDCIYPHVSYFSATSLVRLAERAGFTVLGLTRDFEGQFLALEVGVNTEAPDDVPFQGMGLPRERAVLSTFGERYRELLAGWRRRLSEISPGRCALWGAGAKGVSFLNAADPGGALGAVVDLNPWMRGRFLPVTGHRVLAPKDLRDVGVSSVAITNPAYEREIGAALAGLGIDADVWCVSDPGGSDPTHRA